MKTQDLLISLGKERDETRQKAKVFYDKKRQELRDIDNHIRELQKRQKSIEEDGFKIDKFHKDIILETRAIDAGNKEWEELDKKLEKERVALIEKLKTIDKTVTDIYAQRKQLELKEKVLSDDRKKTNLILDKQKMDIEKNANAKRVLEQRQRDLILNEKELDKQKKVWQENIKMLKDENDKVSIQRQELLAIEKMMQDQVAAIEKKYDDKEKKVKDIIEEDRHISDLKGKKDAIAKQ